MDGWGIGFFKKNRAYVEKSAARAYHEGRFHDGFQRLARVVSSKFIIAHVRLRTSGPIDECHAHPFVLQFKGQDWIFAHNGKAPAIESYRSEKVRMEDAVSDSARTFEYLLDGIAARYARSNNICCLFAAVADTSRQLIEEYPGSYNYLLSNGWVLFAFSNHRQFLLLKGIAHDVGLPIPGATFPSRLDLPREYVALPGPRRFPMRRTPPLRPPRARGVH